LAGVELDVVEVEGGTGRVFCPGRRPGEGADDPSQVTAAQVDPVLAPFPCQRDRDLASAQGVAVPPDDPAAEKDQALPATLAAGVESDCAEAPEILSAALVAPVVLGGLPVTQTYPSRWPPAPVVRPASGTLSTTPLDQALGPPSA
jgi:hypothetical protein